MLPETRMRKKAVRSRQRKEAALQRLLEAKESSYGPVVTNYNPLRPKGNPEVERAHFQRGIDHLSRELNLKL
ncbi:MAG: hypothetical protein P4L59_19680 [Desulfosporosinus sp.]|nr:hypothetical protein [Desulfosporosinus sp.]